ncbi:MAG: hypothetical protein CL915_10760 [Deltaproteobacteria bacterium]|nr:hypothetical protein [Deltaproteobacteria bacterium]
MTTGRQVDDRVIGDVRVRKIHSGEVGKLTDEIRHTDIRDVITSTQIDLNKIVTMMTGQEQKSM